MAMILGAFSGFFWLRSIFRLGVRLGRVKCNFKPYIFLIMLELLDLPVNKLFASSWNSRLP